MGFVFRVFRVVGLVFRVSCSVCRGVDSEFRGTCSGVSGFARVEHSGFGSRVSSLGFRVSGLRFQVSGFRGVRRLGCRVSRRARI